MSILEPFLLYPTVNLTKGDKESVATGEVHTVDASSNACPVWRGKKTGGPAKP